MIANQAAARTEGQGCSWRDRAAAAKQGTRDLRKRRQRRVDLERLRERRGARVTDLVAAQAVARRGVRDARGEAGPLAKSRSRATYSSDVSVALLLSTSENAATPASPISLSSRLQRGEEGQGCSWRGMAATILFNNKKTKVTKYTESLPCANCWVTQSS